MFYHAGKDQPLSALYPSFNVHNVPRGDRERGTCRGSAQKEVKSWPQTWPDQQGNHGGSSRKAAGQCLDPTCQISNPRRENENDWMYGEARNGVSDEEPLLHCGK